MFCFTSFADHSSIVSQFSGHVIVNEAFIQIVTLSTQNVALETCSSETSFEQGNSVLVLIFQTMMPLQNGLES